MIQHVIRNTSYVCCIYTDPSWMYILFSCFHVISFNYYMDFPQRPNHALPIFLYFLGLSLTLMMNYKQHKNWLSDVVSMMKHSERSDKVSFSHFLMLKLKYSIKSIRDSDIFSRHLKKKLLACFLQIQA